MMRVLFDARKLNDFGIGTYIRGLLGATAALRPTWQFDLLVPPDLGRLPEGLRGANVRAIPEPAAAYSIAELAVGGRHAEQLGADLFHAPHYVWPRNLRCPGIVTIHDDIHLRFPGFLPRPLGWLPRFTGRIYAGAMLRYAARQAAHVLTVSEAARADLMRRLRIPPERITAILNGGGAEALAAHAQERGTVDYPDLPERFILFVGNPKPHKNLAGLIDAFTQVADTFPDLHLVTAGGAPPLSTQAQGHLGSRIRALGWLSETALRAVYRRASVACVPSLYEGFGLPALEAMAAGTPVVAAAVGGLPEVVADAGLLVPAASTGALATALTRILRDYALAAQLAARGRQRAALLSWRRAAGRVIGIYERVVQETGS